MQLLVLPPMLWISAAPPKGLHGSLLKKKKYRYCTVQISTSIHSKGNNKNKTKNMILYFCTYKKLKTV